MRPGLFLMYGLVAVFIIAILFLLVTKSEVDCSAPAPVHDGMTRVVDELAESRLEQEAPFCKYRTVGMVIAAIAILYGMSVFLIPKRK